MMKLDFAVRRTCEPFAFRDAPLSENETSVRLMRFAIYAKI